MGKFWGMQALGAGLLYLTFASGAAATTLDTGCGNVDYYTATTSDSATAFCTRGNLNESGTLMFDSVEFSLGISDTGSAATGSPLAWSTDPMDQQGGTGLKDWAITLTDTSWMGRILLELKQGNSYALFDVTGSCVFASNTCSGQWATGGPGNSENDLSHTRAWFVTTVATPLPAAGWALLAALGGLAFMQRRKTRFA